MTDELPPPTPRVMPKLLRPPAPTDRVVDPTPTAMSTTEDGTPTVPSARPVHLSRRERLAAIRAINIPTSIVRRFFQIEGIRKAMLMAFNLFISIIPLMIIAFALVARIRSRISLSQVFIEQFRLHGETAQIVRGAFPPTRNITKVASLIVVGSFALSGFDVASVFQRAFADAWNVKHFRTWRGPLRGLIWFALVFLTFALGQVLQQIPSKLGAWAYIISIPIVMAMNYWFWLTTPRLMLAKPLDRKDLRPGAILGMIGSTALWVLSLVILPGWFSWYGQGFGGIGIALALLSWTYVVSIVWVVIVVISAIMWERSAPIEDVVDVSDADTLNV
jgi:uncharacterized BrkB/YihY/UPF0761 family membrane protein